MFLFYKPRMSKKGGLLKQLYKFVTAKLRLISIQGLKGLPVVQNLLMVL